MEGSSWNVGRAWVPVGSNSGGSSDLTESLITFKSGKYSLDVRN